MKNPNNPSGRGLTIAAASLAVLALAWTQPAMAVTVEGFESGTLPSGSTVGDASNQGVYFSINPTQLVRQLLLTTVNEAGVDGPDGYSNESGTNATSVANVATFLGITQGMIRNGTGPGTSPGNEGSAYKTTLTLNAGDTVSFDYDFLTQEATRQDFAFMVLLDSVGNLLQYNVLAQTSDAVFGTPGATNPYGSHTDYRTFIFTVGASGTYTLGLGVMDATTADTPSALLVDNISVPAVPEPGIAALAVAGVVLLVGLQRFRVRRS